MTTLVTEALSRSFGGLLAVNNVSLSVAAGEIRALIGPNGAGKSTLLNLLAGTLKPSSGRVLLGKEDITSLAVHERALKGLSRSYQVVNLFPELTCRKVVELAVQRDLPLGTLLSRSGRAEIERRANSVLLAAGLANVAEEESTCISHGLQKHLEIAIALANESTVLLLDEPMAGMSPRERVDFGAHLRGLARKRTIVFVEHDIDMVMSLASSVTVLHNGSIIAEGTPDEVRRSVAARDAYLGNRH